MCVKVSRLLVGAGSSVLPPHGSRNQAQDVRLSPEAPLPAEPFC